MRAGHAEPAAAGQPAAPLAPLRAALDRVQAFREPAGIDLQVVDGPPRRLDQVRPADGKRIEAQLGAHRVEQRLERVADVDRSVAAHRAVRRRVGVDAPAAVARRGDAVQRVQQCAGVQDRHQPVARVGAPALDHVGLDRGDRAGARQADLQAHVGLGAPAVGEEALLAREFQPHGAAGGARQQRRDDLEIERLGAVAEAATDEGLDHADRRLVEFETAGERQVDVERHLRHRVQRQPAALGVPLGQRGVRFHHRVRHFGVVERLLPDQIGSGEAGVDVAEGLLHRALDVARLVVVQQGGAFGTRRRRVEVRGHRLQVEHDRRQRGLRGRRIVRGDGGDGLAPVAHAATRERKFVLRNGDHAVGLRAVGAGDDGAHTGQRQRPRHVDAAQDRVCDGTAQDGADQRPARREVGGVARGAGHLLDAVDQRLAHAHRPRAATRVRRSAAHRTSPVAGATPAAACTDSMILT